MYVLSVNGRYSRCLTRGQFVKIVSFLYPAIWESDIDWPMRYDGKAFRYLWAGHVNKIEWKKEIKL